MKGFYQITTAIKEQLQKDIFVNTVSSGDIFEIDIEVGKYLTSQFR